MRLSAIVLIALVARVGAGQQPDTTHRVAGTTVSGVVHDSIAHLPLADAIVQLVAADNPSSPPRTTVSDSLGRFALNDIPVGRYMLGFFHPMLDSLGVETPLREVRVEGQRPVRANIGIPSAARLRAAICGEPSSSNNGAVVIGIVRDARDGSPVSGVTVTAEWLELSLGRGTIERRTPRVVMTTAATGWFAMCNVPTIGSLTLVASRGTDSTAVIEVHVSDEGFLRHDFYLDQTQNVARAGNAERADSIAPSPRPVQRTGDGRLSGIVYTAAEGEPLRGATVAIIGGPQTRTNDRGEWWLVNAPIGTRMLEVRALGYYPESRDVQVVTGAPPLRVELMTLQAVLDTVKVTARRFYNLDRSGFQERRHLGVGRYMTPKDIEKRAALFTSDIFRSVSGVRIGWATDTLTSDVVMSVSPDAQRASDRRILMRGIDGDWCAPAIYINGVQMPGLDADAIDAWARPKDVSGIEIYSEATVPPEFQKGQGRSGCGSIVIWRK
jgi:hypothetical protein